LDDLIYSTPVDNTGDSPRVHGAVS
jgi:hypothetical protein